MEMESKDWSIEKICLWNKDSMVLLYDNYYQALVGYAMQLVDNNVAEDIVQDIFSIIWERRPEFNNMASFKAYLYNSVRNHALNHLRHENVHNNYVMNVNTKSDEFRITDDGSEDMNTEEIYRLLFKAVDTLPQRQREIFLLSMEGKKNAEIAAMLEISAETVKVQKRRAITSLKNKLSPQVIVFFSSLLTFNDM